MNKGVSKFYLWCDLYRMYRQRLIIDEDQTTYFMTNQYRNLYLKYFEAFCFKLWVENFMCVALLTKCCKNAWCDISDWSSAWKFNQLKLQPGSFWLHVIKCYLLLFSVSVYYTRRQWVIAHTSFFFLRFAIRLSLLRSFISFVLTNSCFALI